MKRFFFAFMALALLASCSEPRWLRPDTTAEQTDRDDIDCQRWASREAVARAEGFYGSPYGPLGRSVSRGERPASPARTIDEANLTNFCMRAKGYQHR